jgi:5-methylcytosine-specific restriction endonuclease McrA
MGGVKRMHRSVKKALGYDGDTDDRRLLNDWKKRTATLCKPCWELEYCPYGPVVEDFPLLPPIRSESVEHVEHLRRCLASGRLPDGTPLELWRRRMFKREVASFRASDYPESIPPVLSEASCRVFGHVCPVFFVAEPLTETKSRRSHRRSIPREVMLKVVRRDGQICQGCHQPVPDDEVEFDHVIPYSKGGRSTVENLRLMHRECNRNKSDSLTEILHPKPIEHLWHLQRKRRSRLTRG